MLLPSHLTTNAAAVIKVCPQMSLSTFTQCENSGRQGCAAATRRIPGLIQRQHVTDRFFCYYLTFQKNSVPLKCDATCPRGPKQSFADIQAIED